MSITKHTCLALCVGLGVSFNVDAGDKTTLDSTGKIAKSVVDNKSDIEGMQQTLNFNFSPESREKLRKSLDDYARAINNDNDQIEARRRAMQGSLEARFFDADNDADGTIDRQEATEKLPQIARHFNQVDTNQDNVISLDELEEAQARVLEHRKVAEAVIAAQKLQATEVEAEVPITSKHKGKKNTKRRAL